MNKKEIIEHLKNIQEKILSDIYVDLNSDDIDINQENQYKALEKAIEFIEKTR